ncbi:sulfurtransferase complex subunit TusB [Otariodibacter oris]|uniref:tRNA 2-thiouridine synthesizing protein B n=1 Tax=Otariodibacter oris TaxID=1032623 RepID=A0A420XFY5_9PAST|nr:sulfurtransferase complex subunit TusB [Otariodibacter oris]QGM79923.1 hypothetical protein A6A10_00125 [Otariodibacter oris]RKR71282.1 tRNA 2-thiouridine synthesizing protein B [Otariodibacter oris]
MLYTFSKAYYDLEELQQTLDLLTEKDAVVLWQDGVLLAIKHTEVFRSIDNIFLLENDITARGLTTISPEIPLISLKEFVRLTEHYYPQIAF